MVINEMNFNKNHLHTARILLNTIYSSSIGCLPLITYGEISQQTNRHAHTEVPYDIGDLSVLCYKNKMPMISVIVVNQKTNIPSDGFYDLWRDHYQKSLSNSDIFKTEIKK